MPRRPIRNQTKEASGLRDDPRPYVGPIERIDGVRPFNMYLWPLEGDCFWANRVFGHAVSSRFQFRVIALADGRWATEGTVCAIEGRFPDLYRRQVVFPTREEAIRISVARFIRLCRRARRWDTIDHLSEQRCQQLINWALEIAHRPPASLRPIAQKNRAEFPDNAKSQSCCGLPLFDAAGLRP